MKKFIQSVDNEFVEDERKNIKLYINIETITGYKNIDDILSSQYLDKIDGITLGRVDMLYSLGLTRDDVNGKYLFDIAFTMAKKIHEKNKDFLMGGGISISALQFMKDLPTGTLKNFETRNIIFDAQSAIKNKNLDKALSLAVEFELLFMERKAFIYSQLATAESERIAMLRKRLAENRK